MTRTRVLLADDHRLLADTLLDILEKHVEVVGVAPDGRSMVEMAQQYRPDATRSAGLLRDRAD